MTHPKDCRSDFRIATSYREQNSLLQKTRNKGISIAVIIHSFDRTLQTVLFKQALSSTLYICRVRTAHQPLKDPEWDQGNEQ